MKNEEINFEKAFKRLEQILESLNSGTISLDKSLEFYEEADKLIHLCSKKLNDAEKRVEVLIKKRNGEVALDENQKPITKDY